MKPRFSKTNTNIKRIDPKDGKSERYDRNVGAPMRKPIMKPTVAARKKAV